MKKLFVTLIIVIVLFFFGIPTFCGTIGGDTIACGGTTHSYSVLPDYAGKFWFDHYTWSVEGGVFDNGNTTLTAYDYLEDGTQNVTWDRDQTGVDAFVTCYAVWHIGGSDNSTQEMTIQSTSMLTSFTSVTPNGYFAGSNIYLPPGSGDYTFNATDQGVADEYEWEFQSQTTRTGTETTPSVSIYLSNVEDGYLVLSAENAGDCTPTISECAATIYRKLSTPTWYNPNGYDEMMCTNTTSTFRINAVPFATSYTWTTSGGYTIWNGSQYVSSVDTEDTYVTVKARSSSGSGSINVRAKRPDSDVYNSNLLSKSLWTGVFTNPTVTGTAAVCHNSLYVYTAQVPFGSPSSYTYSWPTKPSGWYTFSTWSNNIQLATPTLAENMTYGPIRVKIQNECGWSTEGGMTVYPGYNCGGYYMASPNPAGDYTVIDIASEEAKALEASYDSEITLTVVDKMGVPMMKEVVYNLPYLLNTSKFPKGEYIVQIISQAKDRETRVDALKIVVNH